MFKWHHSVYNIYGWKITGVFFVFGSIDFDIIFQNVNNFNDHKLFFLGINPIKRWGKKKLNFFLSKTILVLSFGK